MTEAEAADHFLRVYAGGELCRQLDPATRAAFRAGGEGPIDW